MNTPTESPTIPSEHRFTSFDGQEIFYRVWQAPTSQKALVLFHGGHEHSGRFQDLVDQLALDNVNIFAWDARGHGKTTGRRGYARHYMDVVRDTDAFIHHINQHHAIPTTEMVIMGHSVGSVTVATWLHDYAPKVRGVILGSPAFDVKLYVPLAYPALRLWQKLKPDAFVSSYVKPAMLTHDQQEAQERANDSLISPDIAVRVLTSLYDTAKRVITDAHTMHTPVLLLSAGKDWVVKRGAQEKFIENLGVDQKEMALYPSFFHEIYHEAERHRPIATAKRFIEECFATPQHVAALHKQGANNDVFNALQQKPTGWKKYYYALTAFSLKHIGGKLSKGMQIGWQHGFDSGVMLDYVYDNQANGVSIIGKWIDRTYLDSAGWAGIRQRGENLQHALRESITQQQQTNDEVHIMDVATGVGRYITDVIADLPAIQSI